MYKSFSDFLMSARRRNVRVHVEICHVLSILCTVLTHGLGTATTLIVSVVGYSTVTNVGKVSVSLVQGLHQFPIEMKVHFA